VTSNPDVMIINANYGLGEVSENITHWPIHVLS